MLEFRLVPVQAVHGLRMRLIKSLFLWSAALAVATAVVAAVAPVNAYASCAGPCSKEQRDTGLANPPAWAKGRKIHFEPESPEAAAYDPEDVGGGPLEGEGGPLLFAEAGHVQHEPKVYVIYWGSNFNTTEKGIETHSMLQKLFEGLTGSAYQGILTQYFDSTGRISSTVTPTSYIDESVKAPANLTALKVEEEVSAIVSARKWTAETSAQFLLTTAPGSTYTTTRGCAYHGVTTASEKVVGGIVYDFVPYQGDEPFLGNGCVEIGNPTKNPVFKTSKSASHEYAETATDPLIDGWRSGGGFEIADICQEQTIIELPSGAYAQNQYDDHQNSCSHEDLAPPHAYAITGAASSVKTTEATLNGTVNPENLTSQSYFEYGTTKSYGSKTVEVSAGSGIKNVAASQLISGLTPGTTYHFRVAEVNSTGTTTGEDRTFTTVKVPPTVVTGSATGVTATEAILHGTVNPNGFSTTDQFEYGTTTSYGTTVPAVAETAGSGVAAVEKGYVLTGLLPSTTYHFRIKATSSQGTSLGKDVTFTTSSLTPTFSSTFGSTGSGNGQFVEPTGIAVNPLNGNLVVPDEGNNRVEVFNEKGEYLSQFGSFGTGNGQFSSPRGAAVDLKGNIWIIDTGNNRVEKFNEKGEYLSQFGAKGTGNGQFTTPKNLAVDSKGNVWVADSGNKRIEKFNEKGEYVCQFSAGTNPIGVFADLKGNVWSDNENETGAIEEHNESCGFVTSFVKRGSESGQVLEPKRLAVDANGYIWVPDASNDRVEVFNSKGEFVTKFGSFGSGTEQMNYPVGVAVDPRGNIWINDNNNRVDHWKVSSPWPPTFSSNFGSSGTGNGQFNQPTGVAVNPANGNLVVPDEGNNRVEVFNEKGEYLSQFGSFGTGNGQFNQPRGAAVDSKGNIWIIDTGNNRVEKFNEKGEYLSQFGTKGTGNGQFTTPKNLAVDSNGNIWVADSGNKRIEKFNEKGEYVLQFSAGTNPIGVAVDANGNVWTDNENETGAIEEHNEKGEFVKSFASRGSGNGQVFEPKRLAVDANGYIWVPDALNNRVEVFNERGEFVTKFGSLGSGTEQMEYPVGVAVDLKGNVWVDDNNNRVDRWMR